MLNRLDANLRCLALDSENSVLRCALHDILRGNVRWFGSARKYQVGISRASSACGGIAIVRSEGNLVSCEYAERFFADALAHIAACVTGEDTEYNRELLARRAAIEAARFYRDDALRQ
jgi:hypothetical protein